MTVELVVTDSARNVPARGRKNRWKRLKFALWMADPFREGTIQDWATENTVNERTLRRWMQRPEFHSVMSTARERWRSKLPLLAEAVAAKAQATGDPQAFKILAEWTGDYQTKSRVTVENDPYLAILEKIAKAS
jgi:hypothetical protein